MTGRVNDMGLIFDWLHKRYCACKFESYEELWTNLDQRRVPHDPLDDGMFIRQDFVDEYANPDMIGDGEWP